MKYLNIGLLLLVIFSSLLFGKVREPMITLSGKIKVNHSQKVSIKELSKGLEYVQERVYNPYEKSTDLYGGVLLNECIQKYASVDIQSVELIALDDYSVTITKKEWDSMRILLATHMNNKSIPIKDKGPLRIVFPDYSPKELQYQNNISSWIWMIKKIRFK